VAITVGNAAPTASITAPADESLYRDGGAVALRGSATDREDPSLPESAYSWKVLLHHGSHIHEHTAATGSQASFVPATDHDADSYYEVRLTVTDSGGLTHTTSVDIRPETSGFTLASSPAGAPVDYIGAQSGAAPFTREAAVGYRVSVSAEESFVRDGVTYRFAGWSDGGARQHEVTIPVSDSTLTANYTPEGIELAGRRVRNVRLQMYQRDASKLGGRVFAMSSTSWLESMTWNTQPTIDGAQLAAFGAVQAGNYYEVSLGSGAVTGDGRVSLGLDSTSTDGSSWGTRSYAQPPQLLVEVEISP
jgi:hypothetical protein